MNVLSSTFIDLTILAPRTALNVLSSTFIDLTILAPRTALRVLRTRSRLRPAG
jgi:hypothetical protein